MKHILLTLTLLMYCGLSAQNYSGGSGTANDPFKIATKYDLKYLSENSSEWSKHFIQTANILFDSSDFETNGDFYNNGKGFIPIALGSTFTGSYDGNGNIVDGLKIYILTDNKIGLFSWGQKATIKNLGVTHCLIYGRSDVAGLLGAGKDTTVISDCYVTGKIVSVENNAGGLVGTQLRGSVTNSFSSADIVCAEYNSGGLLGQFFGSANSGTLKNCYATGNVAGNNQAGGLIGAADLLKIENCYATGKVTGSSTLGGFVGYMVNTMTVTNSFWDVQSSTQNVSVGSGASFPSEEATPKTTTELQTLSTFINAGWDFSGESTNGTDDVWQLITSGCLSGLGYPTLNYIDNSAPVINNTSGATACANRKTTLTATSNAKLLDWYTTQTGNVIAGRGANFLTPPISSNTSFWVQATNGNCSTARVEVIATAIQPTTSTISPVVCGNYTSPSGKVWAVSNTYTDTIPNSINCDSVITINLTVNQATTSSISPTACGSYTSPSGKVWTASNTYTDTIPNTNNCDSVITINLTISTVNNAVTVVSNATLRADAAGAKYQWIDCNNGNQPIAGDTNQNFVATANGNYAVIVTENGCIDTSACVALNSVGINEFIFKDMISIYPNPSRGDVNISLGEITNATVEVYNAYGQLVFKERKIDEPNFGFKLNAAAGIYLVRVRAEGNEACFHLVKE